MEINEKIENSFKELLTSLQTARLYGAAHPITREAVGKAYQIIREVLAERGELVLGIIGEELAFEKEILFELSKFLKQMIMHLKERGVERIAFSRALDLDELNKLIEFLTIPKEEIKGDPGQMFSLSGAKNISIGKVKEPPAAGPAEAGGPPDLSNIYSQSLDTISPLLSRMMSNETVEILNLKLSINNIVNNLGLYYEQLFKLSALKRYDIGTFAHLLNVSILSMHFSSKLGFNRDVVMDIGLSALFHDIGKLYISRKTIRKPGLLNAQESSQMESHTVLGSKLLLQYVDTIGITPVVVSFEHHLKYDLSGYPRVRFKNKQHIASAIVSVCDVYDALSQRRSYKADYPPDMIHGIMMRGSGTSFEPELLSSFFKVIGVWPIGSLVLLNDKRVGAVIKENEDSIFLPSVKLIYPENTGEIINLRDSGKGIKIERYLSPWSEGKEFLHLI